MWMRGLAFVSINAVRVQLQPRGCRTFVADTIMSRVRVQIESIQYAFARYDE